MMNILTSSVPKYSTFLRHRLHKKLLKSVSSKTTLPLFQSQINNKNPLLTPLVAHTGFHTVHTAPPTKGVSSNVARQELMAIWPDIISDFTSTELYSDRSQLKEWFKEVLQYNVPSGKLIRGSIAVSSFRKLAAADELNDKNIRLMQMLGWCVEIFQASILIADDLMDGATTRRGKQCWHLKNNLGAMAVNDAFLLNQSLFQFLRKHFKKKPYYLDIVQTFHDNIYKTLMGQSIDLISTNFGKKPNLNHFTMDRYSDIVKYKTAYYTFILPVTLAMHVAGIKDPEKFKQVEFILFKMGKLFQIQDDFLDCYGKPEIIGKIGTDIQEGKCSWLIVVALQLVNSTQRRILEECYGINDSEKAARVRQLYEDLDIESIYYAYEKETSNLIKSHIQQISCNLPHSVFFNIMETISERKN